MVGFAAFLAAVLVAPLGDADPGARVVPIALNARQEADVAELVAALARAAGIDLPRPAGSLKLPMSGLGGPLSRALLAETLGPDVAAAVEGDKLTLRIPPSRLEPAARPDWEARLRGLVERIEKEEKRRERYG